MPDPDANLERGRRAYQERAWAAAFQALSTADEVTALAADDLELLARSAYMLGRDDDYVAALDRAHQIWLATGQVARAVRCGFWIGHSLLFRGERARGTGWFARAQRLLDASSPDCVEHGYLLRRVALGKTNRQIAGELFMSEHTVARHIQNIFATLTVSSRTEAASYAFAHKLV